MVTNILQFRQNFKRKEQKERTFISVATEVENPQNYHPLRSIRRQYWKDRRKEFYKTRDGKLLIIIIIYTGNSI